MQKMKLSQAKACGIKFGTDGFRAIIAEDFTFKNIIMIAQAFAVYFNGLKLPEDKKTVLIGYDRRFLSLEFAQTVSQVLSKRGINVLLTDNAVPTPAVSMFILLKKLPAGIIITASHNPAHFNGIKLKNSCGASATKDVTDLVENIANNETLTQPNEIPSKAIKKIGIIDEYVNGIRNYLNFKMIKNKRFSLIVDYMHGTGSGIFEKILKGTRCKVNALNVEHDPFFGGINPEPIAANLSGLVTTIRSGNYDLGLALDGDADRIAAMCPNGNYISSHQAICLLLLHFIENRHWSGRIVKTINTTTLVDKIAEEYEIPLKELPVGFKNIAAEMIKGDVLLGGEESGGIGFKNYMPERDGVLSGLLLLELMAHRNEPILKIIAGMEKKYGKFVYLRKDLELEKGTSIGALPRLKKIAGIGVSQIKDYDGTKFIMEDESWLLVRASGTEPIVRIYAESATLKQTKKLIEFGCKLAWKKN